MIILSSQPIVYYMFQSASKKPLYGHNIHVNKIIWLLCCLPNGSEFCVNTLDMDGWSDSKSFSITMLQFQALFSTTIQKNVHGLQKLSSDS